MINSNPYAAYRQNAVNTARPEELTLMLFNGAVKFVRQAQMALEQKDLEGCHNYIVKVQDILGHLAETLNPEIEISGNLVLLYDYMYMRLIDANVKKDTQMLEEVCKMLTDLRETWQEAMVKAKE
jgi:flagellar protein FliS